MDPPLLRRRVISVRAHKSGCDLGHSAVVIAMTLDEKAPLGQSRGGLMMVYGKSLAERLRTFVLSLKK